MEPFILHHAENGCDYLALDRWMDQYPFLTAGFTTRRGGISKEPYHSLNCGLHVDDQSGLVVENRRRLSEAAGIPFEGCTYAEQVHGKEIQVVTKALRGAGNDSREKAIQAKDGFVTNEPGIFLHALYADCVPLYFFDPVKKAVGLAHAGWRGTALQIAKSTVETMSAAFGSKPRDMLAVIGPSIGMCCYEVDEAVVARMAHLWEDLHNKDGKRSNPDRPYDQKADGKYMLNLQEINRQIMIKAGILPSHIELSTLCTSCQTDLLFSYRKENGKTGRMAAWIGLRDGEPACG